MWDGRKRILKNGDDAHDGHLTNRKVQPCMCTHRMGTLQMININFHLDFQGFLISNLLNDLLKAFDS